MNSPRPSKTKMTRRRFIGSLAGLGASAVGSYEWAKWVEPAWIETTRIDIVLRHLPREFDGFQIAQISDLHIENGTMRARFPAVCDFVSGLSADCIVVTGDFITIATIWSQDYFIKTLPRLKARGGVFGVRGNHDAGAMGIPIPDHPCDMRISMKEGGVHELFNEVHTFARGSAKLHLAGVDDPWLGQADFPSVAKQIPKGEAAVLLAHEPDVALLYAPSQKIGLMLSGHSHGGQVCLPGGFPVHVPPMSECFPRGLYQTEGMWHYTNRGLGTVGPTLRFCSRPEISVFTLRCG